MPQKIINGVTIDVNDEGYMTNPPQWNRDIATGLAQELGMSLTDAHWKVLDFVHKDFKEKGVVPGIRRITKNGAIPTKELYALFPDGPIKKVARISGCPKPTSCV